MGDLASVLVAAAGLITALGGVIIGVIQALRTTDRQSQAAAENALSITNAARHRQEGTTDASSNVTP